MEYTVRIKENRDGWLSGQCEQLPQAISQGKDLDDLMDNMKDAIETVLAYQQEEYRKKHEPDSIIRPLTIVHEAKRISKTSQREPVFA